MQQNASDVLHVLQRFENVQQTRKSVAVLLKGFLIQARVCSTEPFLECRGLLPSESFAREGIVLPGTQDFFSIPAFLSALTCSASAGLWNKDSFLVKYLAVKLEMKGKESWRGGGGQ